ncbi:MAG: extracellular solute-binding protein [Lachnospiraceae bacterium]|nr:extracellular solute-binding protein [Lachnospiraceae bacterium]
MRSKTIKKLIAIILIITMQATLVTACRGDNSGIDPDTIAFLPIYHDIEFGDNTWLQSIVEHEGFLYIYTSSWDEATMESSSKLSQVEIATGAITEIDISAFALPDNANVSNMAFNQQGNMLLLVSTWEFDDFSYTSTHALYEITLEGQIVSTSDIGNVLGLDDNSWLQGMNSNGQGMLVFVIGSNMGTYNLVALNSEGELIGRIEYSDYIDSLFISADGDVYIMGFSRMMGSMGRGLKKADFATGSFGSDIEISEISPYGNTSFGSGGTTGILLSDGNTLYEIDLESTETLRLLDWIDADILGDNVRNFGILENGDIWLMSQTYMSQGGSSMEIVTLKRTTHGELPRRQYLTYGGMWVSQDIKAAIINFNKRSDRYRIQIVDYANSFSDDYQAAVNQFRIDIAGNNSPDIINLAGMGVSQLINKGVLADLNPLIDNSNINRADYLDNILNAYSKDDKLYAIIPGFAITTLIGHGEKLAGIDRWNVTEMIAWAESFPEATLMRATASSLMYTLVYLALDRFINWETGEVDFTGNEFISIMEFAATFGEQWDDWGNPDRIGTHEGFRDGHYLLLDGYLYSLESMQLNDALFDGDAKYIGAPVENGSGIMINPSTAIGISNRSKHKDGAFAFIEYLLSDDFQSKSKNPFSYFIPVKHSAIEEIIAEATNVQMNDGIEWSRTSWGYDDITVEIFSSRNKEFVDEFYRLIMAADELQDYDEQIINIIQEEAESFFAGSKSAMAAAEIIENRVRLYVNENR